MKLVIKEYLLALKEDKELDAFFVELLISMSIVPFSKPQRGRQFGVDIPAVGIDPEDNKKKIFLLTIKQGDLNRSNWFTPDPTSVSPSLMEIKTVFIKNHIPSNWQTLPVKVIVACNGNKDQAILENWAGFEKDYVTPQLELVFWGIEDIMLMVEKYLMNEFLLPKEQASLLRKTLAFLDLSDYDLKHFFELVRNITGSIHPKKQKENKKKIRLLNLCLNILYQWCIQNNNLKPAIYASERAILETWGQLIKHNLKNTFHLNELFRLFNTKQEIDLNYFSKVQNNFYVQDGLSNIGVPTHLEYCLITYEQIGIISSAGLFYLNLFELASADPKVPAKTREYYKQVTENVSLGLAHLISKNPSSLYPIYDEHCIEINLGLLFLFQSGRKGDALQWVNELHKYIVNNYRLNKYYPLFETNYEEAVEVITNNKTQELTSSMLFVCLAEWALVLDNKELYQSLQNTFSKIFKDVNLQIWFPGEDAEDLIYSSYAMHDNGSSKTSILLPENPDDYMSEIIEEFKLFNFEKDFSPIKSGLPVLLCWSNRHFRNYVFPHFWRRFLQPKS